jgi:hypothetical protein
MNTQADVKYCDNHPTRPSRHNGFQNGVKIFECCECYVAAGCPPSDWHPDCMAAYQRISQADRGTPGESR